jgi:hypothetical protein
MKKIRPGFPALRIFALCCAVPLTTGLAALGDPAPFEGYITANLTRGSGTETLLYTVGTNQTRVERRETNRPYPVDILDRSSMELTLLFPNNHSFVRLAPTTGNQTGAPGFPAMPGMFMPPPGGIGPTNLPGVSPAPQMPQMPPAPGSQGNFGASGMPAMPMMPPRMGDRIDFQATTDITNLLGYSCTRYELRQRGEVMEVWATDQLPPFQPYLQNQPHHFGPQMMEGQWGESLKAKKLFPLLAVLRFELPSAPGNAAPPPSPEQMRFEVHSITPNKINDDALFQPPSDYREIQPLPF